MNFYLDFEAMRFSNRIISIGCVAGNGATFTTLVQHRTKKKIDKFIAETKIEEILNASNNLNYYEVVSKDATIEEVLNLFTKNRKLIAVLITKTGTLNETPIGIVTSADVISLNDILDNY